ncbi:MAG TPA: nitroreductase/quinone reductase family protein [Anaerolineales bacterium]|nr:nitroreductase/quinone reductase family protein [Anaerolineales bacterium]
MNASNDLLAKEEYCYLTTTGRVSGRPHEIEIWFGLRNNTVYLLSGSMTSDWVKNLLKNPSVTVRIGERTFTGTARLVTEKDEEALARLLVAKKYHEMDDEETPDEWARTALPVAIDLNWAGSQ